MFSYNHHNSIILSQNDSIILRHKSSINHYMKSYKDNIVKKLNNNDYISKLINNDYISKLNNNYNIDKINSSR